MAGSAINVDVREVAEGLRHFNETVTAQLNVVGNVISNNMKTYAKSNKPWTDRTSSAKNKLDADFKVTDNDMDIWISHGVDYGYYLETRADFNGRYQILEKARDSEVNNFKNMLRNLL